MQCNTDCRAAGARGDSTQLDSCGGGAHSPGGTLAGLRRAAAAHQAAGGPCCTGTGRALCRAPPAAHSRQGEARKCNQAKQQSQQSRPAKAWQGEGQARHCGIGLCASTTHHRLTSSSGWGKGGTQYHRQPPATTAHPGQAIGGQRLGGVQASPLAHQDLVSSEDARQLRQRLLHRVHPAAPSRERAPAAAGDACALPSPGRTASSSGRRARLPGYPRGPPSAHLAWGPTSSSTVLPECETNT